MRIYSLFILLLISTSFVKAQEFTSYEKPFEISLYSEALKDTVNIEITLPKELKGKTNKEYPVIYLLDKQLKNNYNYNLYTIDYLTSLQWMPSAIVVGITFPQKNRTAWSVPNESGGKADNLIQFIEKELNNELKSKFPISDFNFLIGHSRTAILSSYALSKSPEFFNGIIANSVSNFDFGDNFQQQQFEEFLNSIKSKHQKYYFYFSVGEKAYGDLHETAVDSLNLYLNLKKIPRNLQWKYCKHQVAHDLTPGVTVSKALSEIFKDYGRRIDLCFDFAKKSKNEVPWEKFLGLYSRISTDLGFKIEPSELFYNSIASEYYNDYNNIYGDKKLYFTLEILLKAKEKYPHSFDYHAWIGEIYLDLGETKRGKDYLDKAIELIKTNKSISEIERRNYLKEIENIKRK